MNGERFICQSKEDALTYAHPMLIAGDEYWKDYNIAVSFTSEFNQYQSGFVFRYQNYRYYYFFGIKADSVMLKKVKHSTGFQKPNEKFCQKPNSTGNLVNHWQLMLSLKVLKFVRKSGII